jgi:hypothetical protein
VQFGGGAVVEKRRDDRLHVVGALLGFGNSAGMSVSAAATSPLKAHLVAEQCGYLAGAQQRVRLGLRDECTCWVWWGWGGDGGMGGGGGLVMCVGGDGDLGLYGRGGGGLWEGGIGGVELEG